MGPQRRAVPIVPEGTPLGTHCQLGKYLSITLSSGEFQLLGADGKAPSFFQERFKDDQETQWKPEGGPTSKSSSGDHDGSHGSLEHSGDSATGESEGLEKDPNWHVCYGPYGEKTAAEKEKEKEKESTHSWASWNQSQWNKPKDKSKGKGDKSKDKSKGKGGKPARECQ